LRRFRQGQAARPCIRIEPRREFIQRLGGIARK
jgi:hypothetical protein